MSGSTKTGLQLLSVIARMEAMYVFAGTMISLSFSKSKAFIISLKASSPFATPTQFLTPQYLAKFCSKLLFSSPSKYQPLAKSSLNLASKSLLNLSLIFFKSRNLIILSSKIKVKAQAKRKIKLMSS